MERISAVKAAQRLLEPGVQYSTYSLLKVDIDESIRFFLVWQQYLKLHIGILEDLLTILAPSLSVFAIVKNDWTEPFVGRLLHEGTQSGQLNKRHTSIVWTEVSRAESSASEESKLALFARHVGSFDRLVYFADRGVLDVGVCMIGIIFRLGRGSCTSDGAPIKRRTRPGDLALQVSDLKL
ncbi:hypothetical protein HG531_001719 [Fusarium graminearum]|nr:hypothetical protein HG531_001719 [Fusarium graminearum]